MEKFSYNYVKSFIGNEGYTLLSEEYNGKYAKLDVKCPKGHIFKVKFGDFKNSNSRCPVCRRGNISRILRQDPNEVKEFIESTGYKWISNKYKNMQSRLLLECPEGHRFEVKFNNFKFNNSRCPVCWSKRRKETLWNRFSYEEAKELVESEGFKLLSDDYINSEAKLKIRCPKGHEFETTLHSFQHHKACRICGIEKRANKRRLEFDLVKSEFENNGYTLLSTKKDYQNHESKLKYMCPNGHINFMSIHNFKQGNRCPECSKFTYKDYIFPSGNKVRIQGYEDKTIDYLLDSGISEEDMIVGIDEVPTVEYIFKNKKHTYYPDLYIISTNTIIETKSYWTYELGEERNLVKEKACKDNGYNFEFFIWE